MAGRRQELLLLLYRWHADKQQALETYMLSLEAVRHGLGVPAAEVMALEAEDLHLHIQTWK